MIARTHDRMRPTFRTRSLLNKLVKSMYCKVDWNFYEKFLSLDFEFKISHLEISSFQSLLQSHLFLVIFLALNFGKSIDLSMVIDRMVGFPKQKTFGQ
jgi:hypothetical protein